ncbi:MAG: YajQ family cyclic di-GMP-binding protein [Candidatus Nitrohelix vancouverensis]|uniref:Nucleotide-binding protein G3M78_04715 n=1 Tax=Candidatus Nitrohelix vancouverensis TaxID=2705534 RepID=A0A7T0G2X6_9BACT|nr:MAG: YajQ family cyclic di-GMP-binding protein [Candidatus Nitrohelix vancouverensis]
MASNSSFDIVSEVDLAEVQNAINQSMMEIRQRFDFKGSCSEINLDQKTQEIVMTSDDEFKMKSVLDILQGKLVKRNVSLKALEYGAVEAASGGTARQTIKLQQGIPQDKGKEIIKFIKGSGLKKVQAQIQDDQVRVTGKNKDDLQEAINLLKDKDFGIHMSFTNYR